MPIDRLDCTLSTLTIISVHRIARQAPPPPPISNIPFIGWKIVWYLPVWIMLWVRVIMKICITDVRLCRPCRPALYYSKLYLISICTKLYLMESLQLKKEFQPEPQPQPGPVIEWKVSYLDPVLQLYIVHSIVDVLRVLHQSACKLPKAEIRIQNQIELLAFILSVKLSLSLIKVFPISIFLHPTVYVFTLWS